MDPRERIAMDRESVAYRLDSVGPHTTEPDLMAAVTEAAEYARDYLTPEAHDAWSEWVVSSVRRVTWAAKRAEDYASVALSTIINAREEPESEESSGVIRWRTAAELSSTTTDTTEWVAWPLAAKAATTLLTGDAKHAGKTTLMLAAIRRALDGEDWLNRPTVSGPFVYLTEEPDEIFLKDLKEAGLIGRSDLHILSHHLSDLSWAEAIEDARHKAREVGAVGLVVDTLSEWTALDGDAENNAGTMRRSIRPLKAAAATDKLAVVIVTHERKSGGELGKSVRGSTALPGAVDHIVRQKEDGTSTRARKLEMIGRLRTPKAVVVERQPDFSFRLLGTPEEVKEEQAEIDARTVMERLLEVVPVDEGTAMTLQEILDHVPEGASGNEFRRALKTARDAGTVRQMGGIKGEGVARFYRAEGP